MNHNCVLIIRDCYMIAYMRHVFDELIGSPSANHYLAIVSNRFI